MWKNTFLIWIGTLCAETVAGRANADVHPGRNYSSRFVKVIVHMNKGPEDKQNVRKALREELKVAQRLSLKHLQEDGKTLNPSPQCG